MLVLLMDKTLQSLMTEEKDITCNIFAGPTSLLFLNSSPSADAQLTLVPLRLGPLPLSLIPPNVRRAS